jgi:hypothetical protein
MRIANRRADWFVTHHSRPLLARNVGTWSDPVESQPAFAIVMQGPVIAANGFTLETIRIYANHFPCARLILSTWKDTDPVVLEPIRACGVDVVLCEKPADPGNLNINLQITSASAGIRRAAECAVEWVLKTRTDQRLYAPNLAEFLIGIAKAFPVTKQFRQRHRIVALGRGTLKYCLYHVSDQTVFGHIDDMVVYWSPPLRPSGLPENYKESMAEIARHLAPESYFATQFLAKVGREVLWTLPDSWDAFAEHFCVADPGMTDFFWPKYTKTMEYDRRYDCIDTNWDLDFREWLVLYTAGKNKRYNPEWDLALQRTLRFPLNRPDSVSDGIT